MSVPTGHRPPPVLLRRTLANGLRVVLAAHWPTPRTAVSVHYGVGFRHEAPGQEGLAHLVEHLMFRGSANLPPGSFYDTLHPLGGTANGTTHADYTDYFQVVPAQALEQALFREADRMRAPLFTASELASQLDEVGREIAGMRDHRPYGGLPWPGLPAVMFRSFANAHDGYGDIDQLRRLTVDDCAAFVDATYVPSRAVLTIVAPDPPDAVWPLVERHFADIPDRHRPMVPPGCEPPSAARRVARVVPAVDRAAVALGYRLPDPARALPDHLAYLVLARLASDWRGPRNAARVEAGCGFFGPLDARAPDAFVVTSVLAPRQRPDDFVTELTARWRLLADPDQLATAVDRAATTVAAAYRRTHARLDQRCRALGRFELLFGRAELVDELPGLIAGTSAERVARAAREVADAPVAVLVLGPRDVVTPSAPDATPEADPDAAPGADPDAAPGAVPGPPSAAAPGSGPTPADVAPVTAARLAARSAGHRTMPALARPVTPRLDGARQVRLPTGLRVVAVPDDRADLVELRLRVPLGPAGWGDPGRAGDLLRVVAARTGAAGRVAAVGGELRLGQDGQWADVDAWAPVGALPALLRVLADVVTPGELPRWRPLPGDGPPASPARRMDDALRRAWAGRPTVVAAPDDLTALHRQVFVPAGAVLVLVAPSTADALVAEATAALADWRGAGAAGADALNADPLGADPLGSPGPDVAAPSRLIVAGGPDVVADGDQVHLTLCGREPSGGSGEPARYLATALLGGHPAARLAQRCRRLGYADEVMLTRRDVLAGHRRAAVRLTVPRRRLARAVADVRAEVRELVAVPPSMAELTTVRRYCAAQLLTAFDSPAQLADALRHTTAAGRGLDWVVRRPQLLRTPDPQQVSAAVGDLFGGLDHVVVLGSESVDPVDFP